MGEVWLASHTTLGEKVAIKFLLHKEGPGEDDYATARKRFLFEAQAAAKLSRKTRHVVRVTDHGEDGDLTYLVMELLDGDSLDEFIKRAGPQPLPFAADVVSQTARGLAQAHGDGVFHRDLKPANIHLVKDEDDQRLVKILDFGLARAWGSPHSTQRGIVLGSPSYMSPEQARGLANLDYRCDLWALAVVAYKTLTGELPFGSISAEDALARIVMSDFTPARDYRADLPWEVDAFFAKAFAKKIDERFENATKLASAFEKLAVPAARIREEAASPPLPEPVTEPAPLPPTATPKAPEGELRDSDGTHSGATTSQTGSVQVRGLPKPLGTRLLVGGVIAVPVLLVLVFAAVLRSKSAPSSPALAPRASSTPAASIPPPVDTATAAALSSTSAGPSPSVVPAPTTSSVASAHTTSTSKASPAASPRPTTPAVTATATAAATATGTKPPSKDEIF
jgi:eukaryotic-like serine/threonine-protein kinase